MEVYAGFLEHTDYHVGRLIDALENLGILDDTLIYYCDETPDVGCEAGTTVAEDYTVRTSKFNGKIDWVQMDLSVDDYDHLISPEERLYLAMARQ